MQQFILNTMFYEKIPKTGFYFLKHTFRRLFFSVAPANTEVTKVMILFLKGFTFSKK